MIAWVICSCGCACSLQGLAFPGNSAQGVTPPFFNMVQGGLLDSNIFSVWLNPNLAADNAGELVLGGINTLRYSGTLIT